MSHTLFSINGKIVPEEAAVVPVTDRGFLYGDALFETLHAYGPHLFRLSEHLKRMETGFEALGFKERPERARLARWVRAAVAAAGFREAGVRLTVTRGSGPRGPSLRGPYKPFVCITVSEHRRRPEREYRKGVRAMLADFRRQESSVVATLKTTAYVEQILARREADAAGVDEALLLNNAGLLCEGSASNLTLVRGGELLAPHPRLSGALPGIAQLVAFELARKLGLSMRYTALGLTDLWASQEAFLSGSLREFTPLIAVNGRAIGNGRPGPITARLIDAYRRCVARECPGYRF